MAILFIVSFSCCRRRGYCFIHPYLVSTFTLCPSLPHVHPSLVSILTTLFFSEIPTPRRAEAEDGGEKHLLPPTVCSQVHQWELQFSTVCYRAVWSFLHKAAPSHRGMRWHGRCVIPWGPMSGLCWTGVMQKRAVILGAKPQIFSQGVMPS